MVMLDTATVIDIARGKPEAVEAVKKLRKSGLRVSAATVFELVAGAGELSEKKKRVIEAVSEIAFSGGHARQGGEAFATLRRAGLEIGVIDCQIAGTAICENEELMTPDKHFPRVPGLKLVTY